MRLFDNEDRLRICITKFEIPEGSQDIVWDDYHALPHRTEFVSKRYDVTSAVNLPRQFDKDFQEVTIEDILIDNRLGALSSKGKKELMKSLISLMQNDFFSYFDGWKYVILIGYFGVKKLFDKYAKYSLINTS